jgi:hypothetical protein
MLLKASSASEDPNTFDGGAASVDTQKRGIVRPDEKRSRLLRFPRFIPSGTQRKALSLWLRFQKIPKVGEFDSLTQRASGRLSGFLLE